MVNLVDSKGVLEHGKTIKAGNVGGVLVGFTMLGVI